MAHAPAASAISGRHVSLFLTTDSLCFTAADDLPGTLSGSSSARQVALRPSMLTVGPDAPTAADRESTGAVLCISNGGGVAECFRAAAEGAEAFETLCHLALAYHAFANGGGQQQPGSRAAVISTDDGFQPQGGSIAPTTMT